jgi:phage terminase large subunit GpA
VAATLHDPILTDKGFLRAMALRAKHRQAFGVPQAPSLPIPETTLAQFVTNRPWQIDRHAFDWERHQYLWPLYEAFRLEPERTEGLSMVLLKGAQLGASVFGMLGLIFTALKFPGSWLGFYLPDQAMAHVFSSVRFKPMVESNQGIAGLLGGDDASGDNSKRLRTLGTSSISFSYMGGKTSTESMPLLGIWMDEVRRMEATDVALVQQRISHSPYPIDIKLSTAGYPESDIAAAFSTTNQQYWHSDCQCVDGVILSEEWPNCIGIQGEDIFYRCPRCGTRIHNPQDGRYIAHAPSKRVQGFHIPQTLSLAPLHSPAALFAQYSNPSYDRGEFVRSALGRPYVDPEAQLVTDEDLQACENTALAWEKEGSRCYAGIDQMGGWLDIVIVAKTKSEKLRLVHIERIQGDDPFDDGRLDSLMRRYDISCCVCDLNPNWNESMRYSKRWAGRVWLVTYSSADRADMFAWRDRIRKKDQQPNEPDVKFKYIVTLQRYKALDYALGLFRERLVEMPHRRGLVQTIHDDNGIKRPVFMAEELLWPHLKRIVRQKNIVDEEQGTAKMVMVKVGADPHTAFSWTYAVCAAHRSPGGRVSIL